MTKVDKPAYAYAEYQVTGKGCCMSVPPGKTTFTLAEAAELLSCHKETLRRAIARGTLPAARLGKGYRISRVDLEAYWSASGGGELFARDGDGAPAPEKPARPVRKKSGPVQLALPGTDTESAEK